MVTIREALIHDRRLDLCRPLTVLGFAHSNDVIHAAVLPMHVLIEPRGHKLMLIDWCTAVAGGGGTQPVQVIAGGYTSWYRPGGSANLRLRNWILEWVHGA